MRITETYPSARNEGSLRLRPKLRLVYTSRAGVIEDTRYALTVGPNVIGRERGDCAGIALADDARLSRHHALLRVSDTTVEVVVEDVGSKNGTFVNGHRIAGAVTLQDGDVLHVGDSWFVMRYESPPDPLAATDGENLKELIGSSSAMVHLRACIRRCACDTKPVLILGETGTGKELVARALHRLSQRSGELLAVNCGAIPESVADALFFGTSVGAFTGAVAKPGYFRAAQGGTLFLDEIGELPGPLQPKLLRAIDRQEILPVGETRPAHCDARVICATLRDLEAEVRRGQFRQDLYARLKFSVIKLTPLRERREDVLLLLRHSYHEFTAQLPALPPELVDQLLLHPWPLNTRDIQQVAGHLHKNGPDDALGEQLRRSAELAVQPPTSPTLTAPQPATALRPGRRRSGDASSLTKAELSALLSKHKGVIRDVARELGCSRRTVGRHIADHQLDLDQYRQLGSPAKTRGDR